LNLKCDFLVSKFAFKWVSLCRYSTEEYLELRATVFFWARLAAGLHSLPV
jgi:hypothetical protein